MKKSFKAGTVLGPVPVVMVSCGTLGQNPNIITIAWTGIINSNPPMTYISVRKERHSHGIIKRDGEFVINLCTQTLAFATDYCGVKSARDVDKFKVQRLTPVASEKVAAVAIEQCPVSLECKVETVLELPSHDMFIAQIVNMGVDEEYIDKDGKIDFAAMDLLVYNHGEYYGIEPKPLGKFGYSIMKPSTKKRLEKIKGNQQRNKKNSPKRAKSKRKK